MQTITIPESSPEEVALFMGRQILKAKRFNVSPFESALLTEDYEKIRDMLQDPTFDVNFPESNGDTPLKKAIRIGNQKIIDLLLPVIDKYTLPCELTYNKYTKI